MNRSQGCVSRSLIAQSPLGNQEEQYPTGNEKMMTGKRIANVWTIAVVAMGIVGLTAGTANAQLITPTAVTWNANLSAGTPYDPNKLIDGSGLNAPGDETATHIGGTGSGTMALLRNGGANPGPHITFDLGSEMSVGGMWIWNYNQDTYQAGRGCNTIDIYVGGSGDPGATTLALDNAAISFYPVGSGTAYGAQFVAFSASGVRYIRFDLSENAGSNVGLSEVRFVPGAAPATPGTLIFTK